MHSPKGQDGPIWFEVAAGDVHYVPELDLHFKLFDARPTNKA